MNEWIIEATRDLDLAKKHSLDWHKKIEHWRKLYDMDHYVNRRKQGEERYDDPTYTNIVDLGIGIVLANEMEFRAFGWTPSAKEQKDSDKIEKFLAGTLQLNSERAEVVIPYEVLLHFFRDGCAVLYTTWDAQLDAMFSDRFEIPTKDAEGEELTEVVDGFVESPIRVEVIDPLSIFVVPGGPNRWVKVIRVEQMTVADVEMRFGVTLDKYIHLTPTDKHMQMVELCDYWSYDEQMVPVTDEMGMPKIDEGLPVVKLTPLVYHGLMADQQEIWPLKVMEGYETLPFTIGFFKPVDRKKSDKWGHSILQPLESTISMLERAINRRQRQITTFSSLPLVAQVQAGRDVEVDPSLGAVVKIDPSEKLSFPQWQGNPPDVEMQIGFLRARAQQSGFSDVMFGSGPTQVSGYGLSQLGDQNRIRLEQSVQHLQLFWARWARQVLMLAKHFAPGRVLRVYGQLRGEDFHEQIFADTLADYKVRCIIKPEFPNDKVRNHAMATQARGLVSEYTLLQEYLGIEQPEDEMQRKLIEAAQRDPMVLRYGIMKKLREMAEQGDEIAALTLQQMTQNPQQQQMNQMAQAQQSRPEQPVGSQGATGQPPPQATGQLPPGQSDDDFMNAMSNALPGMDGGLL